MFCLSSMVLPQPVRFEKNQSYRLLRNDEKMRSLRGDKATLCLILGYSDMDRSIAE
jgi:hypothetical protein